MIKKLQCEKTNFICASDLLIYRFREKFQTNLGRWCADMCVLLERVSYWTIQLEKTLYIDPCSCRISFCQPMSVATAQCLVPRVPQRKWKTCLTEEILATTGTTACPNVYVSACVCVVGRKEEIGGEAKKTKQKRSEWRWMRRKREAALWVL